MMQRNGSLTNIETDDELKNFIQKTEALKNRLRTVKEESQNIKAATVSYRKGNDKISIKALIDRAKPLGPELQSVQKQIRDIDKDDGLVKMVF